MERSERTTDLSMDDVDLDRLCKRMYFYDQARMIAILLSRGQFTCALSLLLVAGVHAQPLLPVNR